MRQPWPTIAGGGPPGPAGPAGAAGAPGLPGITPITWKNAGLNGTYPFASMACSSDGSRIYACESSGNGDGKLRVSTNYGATWTEVFPDGSTDHRDMRAACDPTGMIVVAVMNIWGMGFKVFISYNGSSSWTDISPTLPAHANPPLPRGIAISDSGATILIAYTNGLDNEGRSLLSTNAGATWVDNPVPLCVNPHNYYTSCAVSASGVHLAIVRGCSGIPLDPGLVYVSHDSGATWTIALSENVGYIDGDRKICMSSSGAVILVTGKSGSGKVSTDYGATWTTKAAPAGAGGLYTACAIVPSGAIMLLTGWNNASVVTFSISRDYGATWIDESQPIVAGQIALGARCASVDEYGGRFLVGTNATSTPARQIYLSLPGIVGPTGPAGPAGAGNCFFRQLDAGDMIAKAITLPSAVTAGQEGNVLLFVVGGSIQRPVIDFAALGTSLSWNGLGLDGVLILGDYLGVVYQ